MAQNIFLSENAVFKQPAWKAEKCMKKDGYQYESVRFWGKESSKFSLLFNCENKNEWIVKFSMNNIVS